MVNRLHRNQVEWSMTTEIRWKQGFDTISIHIDNVSSLAIYITGLYSNFKGWQRWCYWILLIYFNFLSLLIVSSFSQKIVHVDFWVSFTIITSEISCFIKFSFSMFHIFWQQERLWQVNCRTWNKCTEAIFAYILLLYGFNMLSSNRIELQVTIFYVFWLKIQLEIYCIYI